MHENHYDDKLQKVLGAKGAWSNIEIRHVRQSSLHLFVILLAYQGIFKGGPIQVCPSELGPSDDSICKFGTR